MKIFNWMRRGPFTDQRDGCDEKVKKQNECLLMSLNREYKCKHGLLMDDGWEGDGLLTIGTFGLDPPKHYMNIQSKECFHYPTYQMVSFNQEGIIEAYEDGERIGDIVPHSDQERGGLIEYVTSINTACCDDDPTAALIKITKMDGNLPTNIVEKKERVTLADLFSAESAEMTEKPPKSFGNQKPQLKAAPTAKPPLLSKKLNPTSVKHISQPIHKLIKKMWKTKIHPDVEVKIKSRSALPCTKAHQLGPSDSIYLLPTTGVCE